MNAQVSDHFPVKKNLIGGLSKRRGVSDERTDSAAIVALVPLTSDDGKYRVQVSVVLHPEEKQSLDEVLEMLPRDSTLFQCVDMDGDTLLDGNARSAWEKNMSKLTEETGFDAIVNGACTMRKMNLEYRGYTTFFAASPHHTENQSAEVEGGDIMPNLISGNCTTGFHVEDNLWSTVLLAIQRAGVLISFAASDVNRVRAIIGAMTGSGTCTSTYLTHLHARKR
jgi:hypothetical protein